MIIDALKYIVNLGTANTFELNGEQYSDKKLHHVDRVREIMAHPLHVSTLGAIVSYLRDLKRDEINAEELFLHIESPKKVTLFTKLNRDKSREYLMEATPILPELHIGRMLEREQFQILLQSGFTQTEETKELVDFVSSLVVSAEAGVNDDGTSQTVTTKVGISRKGTATVPNPVEVAPIRTFIEVPQPYSKFVFRVDSDMSCRLIEADGGAWRLKAVEEIRKWLVEELKDVNVTILS